MIGRATLSGLGAGGRRARQCLVVEHQRQYGATFGTPTSSSSIAAELGNAGSGARGIVFDSRGPGEVGHIFNVVNQDGVIRFLDGQTGRPATFDGFVNFRLLWTNKP